MRNHYLVDVKNKILNRLLMLSTFGMLAAFALNFINHRPVSNLIIPLLGACAFLIMLYFHSKHRYVNVIRYTFVIFSCFVYYPIGFLTSPGTYSAMAFYCLVFFFISTILVYTPWEFIFPIITFLITLVLFIYEGHHPEKYKLYTTPTVRAMDLSLNFLIACTIIAITIHILNRYFQNEHERIYDVSMTDPLTGIYNRRYLFQMLEQFSVVNNSIPIHYTLMMMDLNNFKKINDAHGHGEGDAVLKHFSELLQLSCRKNDIPIRYGGDEFIIVLVGAHTEEAKKVEERIVNLFEPVCEKYADIQLSVSFGYAESTRGNIEEIIKIADDLLYKNKNLFKNKK